MASTFPFRLLKYHRHCVLLCLLFLLSLFLHRVECGGHGVVGLNRGRFGFPVSSMCWLSRKGDLEDTGMAG